MNPPDLLARCLGYLPQLLDGAITTLWLSAIAVACGFFAGIFIYMMSASKSRTWSTAARVYVRRLSRYASPRAIAGVLLRALRTRLGHPGWSRRLVGLSMNTAAYQSQILGDGIYRDSTRADRSREDFQPHAPPGVVARRDSASHRVDVAGAGLGDDRIVKASAVVSVIAVTDLMRVGQQLSSVSYRPLEVYTLAACFYLAILRCCRSRVGVSNDAWRDGPEPTMNSFLSLIPRFADAILGDARGQLCCSLHRRYWVALSSMRCGCGSRGGLPRLYRVYVWLVRGTPYLSQLVIVYFGCRSSASR